MLEIDIPGKNEKGWKDAVQRNVDMSKNRRKDGHDDNHCQSAIPYKRRKKKIMAAIVSFIQEHGGN